MDHKEIGHVVEKLARQREGLDATIRLDKDNVAAAANTQYSVDQGRNANRNAGTGSVAENQLGAQTAHENERKNESVEGRKKAAKVGLSHFSRARNVVYANDCCFVCLCRRCCAAAVLVVGSILDHGVHAIAGRCIRGRLAVVNRTIVRRVQVLCHEEHFRRVSPRPQDNQRVQRTLVGVVATAVCNNTASSSVATNLSVDQHCSQRNEEDDGCHH